MAALSALAGLVIVRIALLLSLAVNPFLLTRLFAPRATRLFALALSGAVALGLNTAIPVALVWAGKPITSETLAWSHWVLAGILGLAMLLRSLPVLPGKTGALKSILNAAAVCAVAVLPFTHMPGYDTYKVQDAATAVGVTGAIPWMIHPVSLFGFGPRAYCAGPSLLLATIQILGGLGVDWGFFLLSLVSGLTGLFAAALLGERLLGSRKMGFWYALLYVTSPTFLAHNHWAIGRGLYLSLLPLFLYAAFAKSWMRRIIFVPLAGVGLALCHRMGTVTVPLVAPMLLVGSFLPRVRRRAVPVALLAVAALAGWMLVPGANPIARTAMGLFRVGSRLGMVAPLAVLGVVATRSFAMRRAWRSMLLAGLCIAPLAFGDDDYGSMALLPFATLAAAMGLRRLMLSKATRGFVFRAAVTVVLLLSVARLATRSFNATSNDLYEAARFLDAYDPVGPYRLEGPSLARQRLQGYVTGCPGFEVNATPDARPTFRLPPIPEGSLRKKLDAWVEYGRNLVRVSDARVDWYGKDPRTYYLVVADSGKPPKETRLVFESGSVRIFEPNDQSPPTAIGGPAP